jgi:hypothetical protein
MRYEGRDSFFVGSGLGLFILGFGKDGREGIAGKWINRVPYFARTVLNIRIDLKASKSYNPKVCTIS